MLNIQKTKEFQVSLLKTDPAIVINGQPLELVKCFKLLGLYLTSNLSWNTHVEHICRKASKRFYILRILKRSGFSTTHLRKVYCSFIVQFQNVLAKCGHFSLTLSNGDEIEQIQKRALKIPQPEKSYNVATVDLNLSLLSERRNEICKRFYKSMLQLPSSKLNDLIPNQRQTVYSVRHPRALELFKCRTTRFENSFFTYVC